MDIPTDKMRNHERRMMCSADTNPVINEKDEVVPTCDRPAGDRRVRILFLSDHLGHADGQLHGATSYFLSVLPRLDPACFDLTVCFLREPHEARVLLEERGIRPLFLSKGKWDFSVVKDLKRLIRERNIDLVHAAGMKGILCGRWAAHFCGVRTIIHLHDMVPQPLPIRFLQRRMASWTDCALVISDAVGQFAREHFGIPGERVRTLYNGIDLERFAPGDADRKSAIYQSLNLPTSARVCLLIGRLDALKNPCEAVHVLRGVLNDLPDTRLLIVGMGPEEANLRALIQSFGLESHVLLLGQRTDIPDLLGAADVLLIVSKSEGFGLTAIEAMAAGVPVVCPRVGGLPEVVVDGHSGYLCEPGDRAGMIQRVLRLLCDPPLYEKFARAARERSLLFDLKTHVAELQSIYTRLVNVGR